MSPSFILLSLSSIFDVAFIIIFLIIPFGHTLDGPNICTKNETYVFGKLFSVVFFFTNQSFFFPEFQLNMIFKFPNHKRYVQSAGVYRYRLDVQN